MAKCFFYNDMLKTKGITAIQRTLTQAKSFDIWRNCGNNLDYKVNHFFVRNDHHLKSAANLMRNHEHHPIIETKHTQATVPNLLVKTEREIY